jgi:hypothetical protein
VLCIVPLAGPDFYDPDNGAKPFVRVGSETLIEATLGRRPWLRRGDLNPSDIVFVLRNTPVTADASERLARLFPGARFLYLSEGTGGALLSALAGASFAQGGEGAVVIDLADLAFDAGQDMGGRLLAPRTAEGFVPWFRSSDPAYSYLLLDGDRVVETAEKRVISSFASAGVYSFASVSYFLRAVAGCLAHPQAFRVRGALFLCPAYNVLISQGCRIEGAEVFNVKAYSKQFHVSRPGVSDVVQIPH